MLLAVILAIAVAASDPPADRAPSKALAAAIVSAPDDASREALYAAAPTALRGWALGEALLERARADLEAGANASAGVGFAWALRLAEEAGDRVAQARVLNSSSRLLRQRGEYEASLEELERAQRLAADTGDDTLLASALANSAIAHRFLGNYDEALARYERARALMERLGDRPRLATVLNNIGVVHMNRGDHRRALALYEQALAMAAPDDDVRADVHANMASIHEAQGELALAAAYLGRALAQDKRGRRGDRLPYDYALLGDLARRRGRTREAVSWYAKARDGAARVEDAAVESEALTRLGELAAERGAIAEALPLLERGRERAAATREREGEARAETALARVLLRAGRGPEALGHARGAVALAEGMHAPALLWHARTAEGRVLATLGRAEEARGAFEAAVAAIEEWREQVAGDEEPGQLFLEDKLEPYHALVALHADGGRVEQALAWAEQAHARTLTDALRHGRSDLSERLDPAERAEQARLERRLLSLHQRRTGADAAAAREVDEEIGRARLELAAFRARAYAARPDLRLFAGQVASDPVVDAAPLLDPATAVVVYTAAADRLHAFVLTLEDGRVRPTHVSLPIGARALATRVERFRGMLARRDLGVRAEARRIHRDLLEPVAALLRGRTRLVIVPDGALWELPFAALARRAGRYLVEDASVSYAPSLAALAALRARPLPAQAASSIVAVGDPALSGADARLGRLPTAARQARAIGRLYLGTESRVLVGSDARESRVRADAPAAGILHLATHGTVDDASPLFSHLSLTAGSDDPADDGRLEAREVLGLRLAARLVVLSACETGRGRVGAGEGTIGLSWAFAVAGASTVVASHWRVDAASTGDLMIAFHRHLRADDADVAEALRTAALDLMRDPRYRHPFYWAGFFAVGTP